MYIGSTDERGLVHIALEVLSNSLDEVAAGTARRVDVRLDDAELRIEDDGRGFPFGEIDEGGEDQAIRLLSTPHEAATADGHAPHIHAQGPTGVGLYGVSALCERMTLEAVRHGVHWRAVLSRGQLDTFEMVGPAEWRGTRVRLKPDPLIFSTTVWPMHLLRREVIDQAHLMPELTISLGHETFAAPNGLADRIRLLARGQQQPVFHARLLQDAVAIEVAAADSGWLRRGYRVGAPARIESWCNGSRTDEHGAHVDGSLHAFARQAWWPDVLLVSVLFASPEFAGPSRGYLRVPGLREVVANALEAPLADFVAEHVRERP